MTKRLSDGIVLSVTEVKTRTWMQQPATYLAILAVHLAILAVLWQRYSTHKQHAGRKDISQIPLGNTLHQLSKILCKVPVKLRPFRQRRCHLPLANTLRGL